MKKYNLAFRTAASGAVLAMSLAGTAHASVDVNPFGASELNGGYRLAQAAEAKCGEAKCGGNTEKSKASEAKCGGNTEKSKASEAKCGEAKCGAAAEKPAEKTIKEAKCGEAKCGGSR
ncbi:MAG: low-complexity protein [Thiohalomonadaceae bacterium]